MLKDTLTEVIKIQPFAYFWEGKKTKFVPDNKGQGMYRGFKKFLNLHIHVHALEEDRNLKYWDRLLFQKQFLSPVLAQKSNQQPSIIWAT